jgi:hypothetical protein
MSSSESRGTSRCKVMVVGRSREGDYGTELVLCSTGESYVRR